MFTLGIPKAQYRRATNTLSHDRSGPIEYETLKQDDGFYMLNFPGVDSYEFKKIVMLLKKNGITTLGADDQLTERKIMKLSNLIKKTRLEEYMSSGEFNIIDDLKRILVTWETKQYPDDKTRWEEYYMDIEQLVTDYEENAILNAPDTSVGRVNEEKIRKFIQDEIKKLN